METSGAQRAERIAGTVYAAFERAPDRDKLLLARLMARLSDSFSDSVPILLTCGDGMQENLGYWTSAALRKALAAHPELIARLLRDADPVVVEATIAASPHTADPRIQRSLLLWAGSAHPRFRGISAYYIRVLPMEDRHIVFDRVVDDPDYRVRREAIAFLDQATAKTLFPKMRIGAFGKRRRPWTAS